MNFFELLSAAPEIGLKLLTPQVDLDKPVKGIDVSETPDIHHYIAPETLLLTTAMLYRDDRPGLMRLIENLHRAGVAGLAVKLGRFLDTVDQAVLIRAGELNFPIFQIPKGTTLGIAAHQLQSHISGIETKQLYYALDIQKKVSQLVYQNSSLEELIHYFARLLKQCVLFFDFFFDLFTRGQPYDAPLRLSENEIAEIGRSLRAMHQQRPISSVDEFILPGPDNSEIRCLVVPIEAGREFPYFLTIVYQGNRPELFSYFVAESASNVFAFTVHNSRLLLAREWSFKEEAFRRLLEREDKLTVTDLRTLSPSYTDSGHDAWQLTAIGFSDKSLPEELKKRDTFDLAYHWLLKKSARLSRASILVPLPSERRFVLLMREPAVLLRSTLKSMEDGLGGHLPLSLKFGVANQMPEISSLRFAYIQASLALSEILEKGAGEMISVYHSKGIQELFQFVPPEHVRHFCLHILKEMAYPESEYDQELRQTLEIYLNCQSDISQTAKTLGIHRNTVKYRIEKTRHILGFRSDHPENSLELRLAIMLSNSNFK